jgi:hypothetical protein
MEVWQKFGSSPKVFSSWTRPFLLRDATKICSDIDAKTSVPGDILCVFQRVSDTVECIPEADARSPQAYRLVSRIYYALWYYPVCILCTPHKLSLQRVPGWVRAQILVSLLPPKQ